MAGIVEKLKNKHFLSLSGNIIMSGVGMVIFAILYHALTPVEMGVWIFFQTVVLLLDTVRSGFLTTAFIKFYTGTEKKRADEIMGATWFIGIAITGVFVAINGLCFLLLPFIADVSMRVLIKWSGVTFICMLPYYIATCVVQAEQRFDRLLLIRFITQFIFGTSVIVLIFLHKTSLQNVVLANLGAALVTSIVTLSLGFSNLHKFGKRTKAAVLEMFHFGKYSVGTSLSSGLFGKSDVFIIKIMLGPAAVAVYSLGIKFLELVEIPLRSFAATATPSLSSAFNRHDKSEIIYIYKKYAGMTTIMLIPACIAAVLLANFLIGLVGGGQYAGTAMGNQAANVYRLYMAFAWLYPADRFFGLTLDVINKPHINVYKIIVMLAANVLGDVGGILIFGNVYGVAITTFLPILIGTVIGYRALIKYHPFRFIDVYKLGYAEVIWLIKPYWRKITGKAN